MRVRKDERTERTRRFGHGGGGRRQGPRLWLRRGSGRHHPRSSAASTPIPRVVVTRNGGWESCGDEERKAGASRRETDAECRDPRTAEVTPAGTVRSRLGVVCLRGPLRPGRSGILSWARAASSARIRDDPGDSAVGGTPRLRIAPGVVSSESPPLRGRCYALLTAGLAKPEEKKRKGTERPTSGVQASEGGSQKNSGWGRIFTRGEETRRRPAECVRGQCRRAR